MSNKSVYPVCFWCGSVFEQPIILGDEIPPEVKNAVPEKCVINYDPCPKCFTEWTQGQVFIECDTKITYESQPELGKLDGAASYPTGRMCVIPVEKAAALFGENYTDEPISFFSKEIFKMVFETEPQISCFWCAEPFDGVKRAERCLKAVKDYEPCDACKSKWAGKCVLFECDYTSDRAVDGVEVICDGKPMHPTGRMMRLDFSEAKRLMGDVGETVFISASKFRILSGEDKLPGKSGAAANVSSAPRRSVLTRNDGN